MPKNSAVAIFRIGADDQEVPFKGLLPGVRVSADSGRKLRVENRSAEPISVNGGKRPLRPGRHTIVHNNAVLGIGEDRFITRRV